MSRLTTSSQSSAEDTSRMLEIEPVKAYLRIRPPPPQKEVVNPYIEVISDTEVLMHNPTQTAYSSAHSGGRSRTTSIHPPTKYIFSKVFGSQATSSSNAEQDTSQSSFFQHTTLPLVQALLQGESGLMFTYGVTNSGKSHTVMGNTSPGGAGILPRALDVIFNSIKGLESTSNIRPVGLSGVQRADKNAAQADTANSLGVNPFSILGDTRMPRPAKQVKQIEHDSTTVPVDRNLRYSVFVSYVEIYNEKLFDLLDASPNSTLGRSESVRGSNWSLANMANAPSGSIPASASSITLNRKPLSLKNDPENNGKYVGGLREIKITSAKEARDLLHRGQENRAVFGTMANRASSRSHGIFTIKVIRHHGGLTNLSDEDLDSFTTARLSIVDLAGSERVANTGLASGERLKEAGNINKSLMCLGQCLETLRKNQIRLTGTTDGGQAQTVKRRVSIVPFRHSKLTELFQSFFVGEGKAVMIVNANPYDTGFDENSHVMKFSAIAKEVAVPRHLGPVTKTLPPLPAHKEESGSSSRSLLPKSQSSVEMSVSGSEVSADVTIIEDDEEDDQNHDPFVDMLVEKHEELRQKLYAAELRCATIEAQVRDEMADELERRLLEIEELYNRKMVADAEENVRFMNRKIDLLVSTNARNEPELREDSDAESQDSDFSREEEYESGHEEEEAEVEWSLAGSAAVAKDRSMSEVSGGESVFDDATEGDFSRSNVVEDDSDEDEISIVDESAILKPGRPSRAAAAKAAVKAASSDDESMPELNDDGSDSDNDADEDLSSAVSADDQSEDDYDEDEGEQSKQSRSNARASTSGEIYVEIPPLTPGDTSLSSLTSESVAEEVAASDSSFDLDAASDSSNDRPSKPTRKNPNRTSTSTTRARPSRSSRKSSLLEPIALTDLSDASVVLEDATPKKKRKLRKKAAVQEDDWVDQIGDSSLAEAVYHQSASNRSLVQSGRTSKSFGSRRSSHK